MSISKDNEQNDEQPQAAVDLEVALKQMKDDGMPPTGFHMMFFSEDFKTTDDSFDESIATQDWLHLRFP